ncbi:MAG: YidC/Oxa1 family membrane protein insertase [bacterium]
MIGSLYNTILFEPILNLLIYIYDLIPYKDVGISIIIVTIIIRLLLLPLSRRSFKSQRALQELQPRINEIKEKFKDDKEAQSRELLKFYQENKINPLGSCLPLLLQLPIIFALYRVFGQSIKSDVTEFLYPFVPNPGTINHMFFGFVNLSESNLWFALLAGGLQYIQSRQIAARQKKQGGTKTNVAKNQGKPNMPDMSQMMGKQMLYFMPIMTTFIAMSLPSGLALYWVVTTLFAIIQQAYIMKGASKNDDSTGSPKDKKEVVVEAK